MSHLRTTMVALAASALVLTGAAWGAGAAHAATNRVWKVSLQTSTRR